MIANITRGKSFRGVFDYLLRESKRAEIVYANLAEAFINKTELVKKFEEHALLHKRVRQPVYHLSLSPAHGDNLSPSDWIDSVKRILTTLELNHHQAIAIMHRDTYFPDGKSRPHLHLVVNAIGDDGLVANFLLRLFQNRALFART